jgi:hypothetical protein
MLVFAGLGPDKHLLIRLFFLLFSFFFSSGSLEQRGREN